MSKYNRELTEAKLQILITIEASNHAGLGLPSRSEIFDNLESLDQEVLGKAFVDLDRGGYIGGITNFQDSLDPYYQVTKKAGTVLKSYGLEY